MKRINCLLAIALLFAFAACKKDQSAIPASTLSGTWILTQKQLVSGNKIIYQNVSPSPRQTITFDFPSAYKGSSVQDSLFSKATFFVISNGGIAGPNIYLYKSETPTGERGSIFSYNAAPEDSLFMQSMNGSSVTYKFRRQ